jgi:hypothetical protein
MVLRIVQGLAEVLAYNILGIIMEFKFLVNLGSHISCLSRNLEMVGPTPGKITIGNFGLLWFIRRSRSWNAGIWMACGRDFLGGPFLLLWFIFFSLQFYIFNIKMCV